MFKKCWENTRIINYLKGFNFFTKTVVKQRNRNYNFYDVLGLDRKCSNDEVLDAYIRLSKQYHPDVNKDNGAEEKYKSITMAFEALSNQMNRDLYDAYMDIDPYSTDQIREEDDEEMMKNSYNNYEEYKKRESARESEKQDQSQNKDYSENEEKSYREKFSKDFESFFNSQSKSSKQQEQKDIVIKLEVSLHDVFMGSEKTVSFKRIEKCGSCFGYKTASGYRPSRCFNCDGSGEVNVNYVRKKCSQCNGEGFIIKYPCQNCEGKGLVEMNAAEAFKLPKGISTGTNIRIDQKGHASISQAISNGDLLIKIMVKDSKEFVRKDDDLISRKEITLLEAIRGESNLQVDSIDGPCRVQIPPGSQNNQQIIISNKGLPKLGNDKIRGNLLVTLNIKIPNLNEYNIDSKEKLKEILKKIEENQ